MVFFFFHSGVFHTFIDRHLSFYTYRVVIKKMLKSSLDSTLRLLKKSFCHYYTLLTHPSRRNRMSLWKRKRKQLLLKMMVGWRLENGIGLSSQEM